MDDMKVSSSFDCPTECNTIKYSVKEKIVPIDPNQFCPKPKSLWVNTNLNNRPNLPEIVNFFYSKVFKKYNTSERLIYKPFYDTIIEDICVKMVRDEIAMVSIYFPHGTYTKIQQALKFTFTDKIASFGNLSIVISYFCFRHFIWITLLALNKYSNEVILRLAIFWPNSISSC